MYYCCSGDKTSRVWEALVKKNGKQADSIHVDTPRGGGGSIPFHSFSQLNLLLLVTIRF